MELRINSERWQQAAAFFIRYQVFVIEQGIKAEEEFDQIDLDRPPYIVIYDQNLPVATGRYLQDDEQTFRVSRLATLKSYRGQGLATQIVQAIEQLGREHGLKHCLIHADCTALPFYQSLGYQICSEIYLEDGVECVNVEKYLL
ncbi:GNAT family N-acetyltransferase [Ignavigranum ruoffiae]|uniref:GNAT family N-acetyltransferase n=1 Tax=Ignavigranum ruoffiae TaxID=89093 RepID=UPI0024AD3CAF|nr:GNAT family N-acetyltransferase [Ignavigranum ruoffiae]